MMQDFAALPRSEQADSSQESLALSVCLCCVSMAPRLKRLLSNKRTNLRGMS